MRMMFTPKGIFSIALLCGLCEMAAAQDTTHTIPDSMRKVQLLDQVVISASRVSEKLLLAPVSISKLTTPQIAQSAAPSFFDAIGNMKGVHMIVPSLSFKIINTRGFSNTTNVRFVQLVDNIDNQSPHIGAPIANVLCPSDLDIEDVEIVQGVASAMYGLNATNGLANFKTKDPFTSAGLSIQQQTGVNHISDPNNVSPQLYNGTNLRWAQAFSPKWAVKLNAGFTQGYDWVAGDATDLNPTANTTTGLTGADNPGVDPVSSFGNESSNRKTLTLNGKNYVVARTGYWEKEVTDYHFHNIKGDVSVYFRPHANHEFSYTWRAAFLNTIYQRSNRFLLKNYRLQQNIFQYKSPLWQARIYVTSENTGNSYNLRSAAENMDNSFKAPTQWYNDYTKAFNTAIGNNASVAQAHHMAREAADNGRYQPGTDAFNQKLNELADINNWDVGAALRVRAHLVHTEATLDLGKWWHTSYELQVGGNFRDYVIVPDGNYFINPVDSGKNLNYTGYGFFVRASDDFFKKKLQLSAVLRASKNEYFPLDFNPRVTAVYALSKTHSIRFSYQNGYRFPSIFEGFSNINSGGVKRVGGLKVMSNGVFENSWLKSSIDAFQAMVNSDVNTQGLSLQAAIDKNKGLLRRNDYTYLKPEQMHSFETGYRSALFHNKLFLELDGYYNIYSNFIAQIEASIPNTSDSAAIPAALYDRNKQSRYRLWTNSKTVVHNYGVEIDLRFVLNNHYSLSGNVSYQTLKKTSKNDGLEDGFNTPGWMGNLSFTGANVYKQLGFNVSLKYQNSFYYQSFLVNGNVPSVFNADAQVQYTFAKQRLNIKAGGTNILNHYYYSILGGPQVGGFYYTTVTYVAW